MRLRRGCGVESVRPLKNKKGGTKPPFSYSATRFVTSRYFPLTGLTSGYGACADLQRASLCLIFYDLEADTRS